MTYTDLQQLYHSYQHYMKQGDFQEIESQMKACNVSEHKTEFLSGMLRYSFAARWHFFPTWNWFLHLVGNELTKRGEPTRTILAGLFGSTELGRYKEWPKGDAYIQGGGPAFDINKSKTTKDDN